MWMHVEVDENVNEDTNVKAHLDADADDVNVDADADANATLVQIGHGCPTKRYIFLEHGFAPAHPRNNVELFSFICSLSSHG